MVEITNRARGPRLIWEKDERGNPRQRILQVGETADVQLHNPDDPILKVWKDQGQIVFGEAAAGDDGEEGAGSQDAELDKLSDDELRAYLTERGVQVGNWGRRRLLAEAERAKAGQG
ncbi:hypothetical protein [Methylobacterium nodulans]|uniref:Uncharacterized protein n=1 Tax=Methylobacterium nodulans (strain LMG 21967 / CNCM I-2342 / ORS 2060) TaxID=460265 RepID=B8IIV1_METNO|nr:hypothetical protein [Methylobacterium nodulans]ACL61746.1 hypothetical protein Mnod_7004 [Methylobacterium nodulans ORS 2060]